MIHELEENISLWMWILVTRTLIKKYPSAPKLVKISLCDQTLVKMSFCNKTLVKISFCAKLLLKISLYRKTGHHILLHILLYTSLEDTFENAQWRKIKQMQPMWLCTLTGRPFEETFENAQQKEIEQMQPMWFCILTGRPFKDTFENAQWRKVK